MDDKEPTIQASAEQPAEKPTDKPVQKSAFTNIGCVAMIIGFFGMVVVPQVVSALGTPPDGRLTPELRALFILKDAMIVVMFAGFALWIVGTLRDRRAAREASRNK
jgi:hypothetical protein